jgi:hypothetical protein
MTQSKRRPESQGRRKAASASSDMNMALIEELRRRIEMLENSHSGIGSEVAVVKNEVTTVQRDVNFVRSSVDALGLKLDTILTNLTTIQTQQNLSRPRDPLEMTKTVSSIVVSLGVLLGFFVGAVAYVSSANKQERITADFHNEAPYIPERTERRDRPR